MDSILEVTALWNEQEEAAGVPASECSFVELSDRSHGVVLLIHGAGGSPADYREMASALARYGFSSWCPLLPHHGRGPLALGSLRFDELADFVAARYDDLRAIDSPFVVGQSLGGVLAARLAMDRPVRAWAALAPALLPAVGTRALLLIALAPFRPKFVRATFRWQMNVRRGIQETKRRLSEIEAPVLILHSRDDSSVRYQGSELLRDEISSTQKTLRRLEGQGHVLSMCPERITSVFRPVGAFFTRVTDPHAERIVEAPNS